MATDDPHHQHTPWRPPNAGPIESSAVSKLGDDGVSMEFTRAHARMLSSHDRSLYGWRDDEGKFHAGVVDIAVGWNEVQPYVKRGIVAVVGLLFLNWLHDWFHIDIWSIFQAFHPFP